MKTLIALWLCFALGNAVGATTAVLLPQTILPGLIGGIVGGIFIALTERYLTRVQR